MGIQLAGKDWQERLICQSILTLTVMKNFRGLLFRETDSVHVTWLQVAIIHAD